MCQFEALDRRKMLFILKFELDFPCGSTLLNALPYLPQAQE